MNFFAIRHHFKSKPRIIYAIDHKITPKDINQNALTVLDRLYQAGFDAYLVGGGVRDLILGKHPKDFDIATNATPKDIKQVFESDCIIIGRRFRLAHVRVDRQIFEVSTFRAEHDVRQTRPEGIILRDNQFGTIEQDVYRRDFTINALYYDARTNAILDFTHGFEDLENRVLRMIGDPEIRYREDPVRMLRAIRFIAKLNFSATSSTKKSISKLKHLLRKIPAARLYDETLKLFLCGFGEKVLSLMEHYNVFEQLFPFSHTYYKKGEFRSFFENILASTDRRVGERKVVIPSFLFAGLLFPAFLDHYRQLRKKNTHKILSLEMASKEILTKQAKYTQLPQTVKIAAKEIWLLQYRLEKREYYRILKWLSNARFRAAYDLLCLRAQSDKNLQPIANWWTQIQTVSEPERYQMIEQLRHNASNLRNYSTF